MKLEGSHEIVSKTCVMIKYVNEIVAKDLNQMDNYWNKFNLNISEEMVLIVYFL